MRSTAVALAAGAILWGACAWGQAVQPVPGTMGYQGMLLSADGVPETGLRTIQLRLYASDGAPTANALWGEQYDHVPLVEGVFQVEMGAGAAIASGPPRPALKSVFNGSALWLGIAVESGGAFVEQPKRQQFTAVPYALTADTAIRAKHGVPPGTIAVWAGAAAGDGSVTPPEGWLFCDGTQYSRTADDGKYAALGAALGNAWGGSGDTFQVPDLAGAILVGAGTGRVDPPNAASANLTNRTLGQSVGSDTHTLTLSQIPAHSHSYTDYFGNDNQSTRTGSGGQRVWSANQDYSRTTGSTGGIDTNSDGTKDAAAPHSNIQPSIVTLFIIKY